MASLDEQIAKLQSLIESFDFSGPQDEQDKLIERILHLSPKPEILDLMFQSDDYFDQETEKFKATELATWAFSTGN